MTDETRAISTVIDVAMALALISASAMVLVVFMEDDEVQSEPRQADHAGETTLSTTFTVTYSVKPITEQDEGGVFESGSGIDDMPDHAFTRTTHGPVSGLLADAAVSNVTFWGEQLTPAGEKFEASIDAQLRGEFTGSDTKVRVDAVWRPYKGSDIVGEASAGPLPPEDEDVNSVTVTVPSGFESVSDEIRQVRSNNPSGFEESAEIISKAIIDGLLPPEELQRALERQGIDRRFAAYRYDQMSRIVSQYDSTMPEGLWGTGNLEKSQVNTWHLNDRLVGNISSSVIGIIAGTGLSGQVAEELDELFDSTIGGEELAKRVSTGEVTVLIRTWETDGPGRDSDPDGGNQ